MSTKKKKIVTVIILIILAAVSLEFVNWVCQMAFNNTCIEMEEQYISIEVDEEIDSIENSIDFGKSLGNYYGMDKVLDTIEDISKGNLKVIVADTEGKPLYLSFEESDENIKDLAAFFDGDYQQKLLNTEERGRSIEFNHKSSLVYPIYKGGDQLQGYLVIIYNSNSLIDGGRLQEVQSMVIIISAVVAMLLILMLVLFGKKLKGKADKIASVAIIMTAMFVFIVFLFDTYREKYDQLINDKTVAIAQALGEKADAVVHKGLAIDKLNKLDDYFAEKEEEIESIEALEIVNGGYFPDKDDKYMVYVPIASRRAAIRAVISADYIKNKIWLMTLTFGAVFVVCLMFAYELTHLVEVVSARFSYDFNKVTEEQNEGISAQIRVLSFLAYTAIYISLPYAAVIMRKWDASIFGLSKSVSASIPLTVELLCVLLASAVIQKLYDKMKLSRMMVFVFPFLILGNIACTTVSSPYKLIALRAFCGIGFAFMKYWINAIVAATSNEENFSANCGMMNAGLLGGITIGASLGSIFAEAMGYQSNYLFTALIFGGVMVWVIFTMPWKVVASGQEEEPAAEKADAAKDAGNEKGNIFKNPRQLLTLLFGCIPLNIGLMYVVAFVPSYMSNAGHSAVVTSYVYLINGLAGIYLGMIILKFLKHRSLFTSASIALFLAAGGMLVLLVNKSLAVIFISAGVLGLFDGFGTPSITSYFTSLTPKKSEVASMMTTFNIVGSAVQIVCPTLYNLLIQPDGKITNLMIFGIAYIVVAVLFVIMCRPEKKKEAAKA